MWRASFVEPGREPLSHEAASYDACLSWTRGILAVREARPGATLALSAAHGARRRYSVRGGGGASVTIRVLEE